MTTTVKDLRNALSGLPDESEIYAMRYLTSSSSKPGVVIAEIDDVNDAPGSTISLLVAA